MIKVIIGFLAGVMSSMGFGGGSVLLLYLTLFAGMAQKQAAGINLIYFIPCAAIAAVSYVKNKIVLMKPALVLGAFSAAGALMGALCANYIDDYYIRKVFAVILLFVGINGLFAKKN